MIVNIDVNNFAVYLNKKALRNGRACIRETGL